MHMTRTKDKISPMMLSLPRPFKSDQIGLNACSHRGYCMYRWVQCIKDILYTCVSVYVYKRTD